MRGGEGRTRVAQGKELFRLHGVAVGKTRGGWPGARIALGFTLMEIVLTIGLAVVATGIGLMVARGAQGHASVRSIASSLLSDLRWARQRARSRGVLAGVLLPSGPVATQTYAVVTADPSSPTVLATERIVDWSRSGVEAFLGAGTWAELAFSIPSRYVAGCTDPALLATFDQWVATCSGRFVLFSPSGAVMTHDVPQVGEESLLVVAAGMEPVENVLGGVRGPAYTVRITPSGATSVEEGLPEHPARLQSSSAPRVGTLPSSLPPVLLRKSSSTNRKPTVVAMDVLPTANDSMLPTGHVVGQTFSVAPDGRLVISVKARDPDGDTLYCTWGSEPVLDVPVDKAPTPWADGVIPSTIATSAGTYSASGLQPMTWSASDNAWTSTVEWTPPAGLLTAGQWFTLGVIIDDLRGGRTSHWIVVGVTDDSKIHFLSDFEYTWLVTGARIYVMNGDGTGVTSLSTPHLWGYPSQDQSVQMSPDGQKILVVSSSLQTSCLMVYAMNSDGTEQTAVHSPSEQVIEPSWSPSGSRVAFVSVARDGSTRINTMQADGSDMKPLASSLPGDHRSPWWSPDGRRIAFIRRAANGPYDIYIANVDDPGLTFVPDGLAHGSANTRLLYGWSPADGMLTLYCTPCPPSYFFKVAPDGSGTRALSFPGGGWFGCWSRDDAMVLLNSELRAYDVVRMNADGSGRRRLIGTPTKAFSYYPYAWR